MRLVMHYELSVLAIHGERQLFFDDPSIETVCEVTRTFHQPTEYDMSHCPAVNGQDSVLVRRGQIYA